MRVAFSVDTTRSDGDSGKERFIIRLAKALSQMGVKIVDDKSADIYVSLAGEKPSKKARSHIVRVDGLIFNTDQDYNEKNRRILSSIASADGIIYQTKFCKLAYKNFFNLKKKSIIIPNGADPQEFLPRNPQNFFLANCKWRPHKRLKTIIDSFLVALDRGLDSDLYVTGNPDFKISHDRIKYLGWQNREQLKELLSKAVATLHLTWLDWCPNAMVESIVSGCPVIYTSSGGHSEVAEGSGIMIKDTDWDFSPCRLYAPPPLNLEEVANAMIYLKKYPIATRSSHLDIAIVAKRYLEFFMRIRRQNIKT